MTQELNLLDSKGLRSEPLVRLMTVKPFLSYARERGIETRTAFSSMGLKEEEVHDPDRFVHAEVVYGLTNNLAAAAKDPYLGVSVGESFDVMIWPHWADAVRNSKVLVGFLVQLVESTRKLSSAVTHTLEVNAQWSTYRVNRLTTGGNSCGQVDGFGLATFLRLFRQLKTPNWSPSEMRYETASPEAIPPNYQGITVASAEPGNVNLIFPTIWLHFRLSPFGNPTSKGTLDLETPSIALAVKNVASDIFTHERGDLKPTVASRLGLSSSDLDSALQKAGTTFNQVMLAHRLELAKSALSETEDNVAEISRKLGFANAANFTRFFKSRAGSTPRDYRKSMLAKES